MNENYKWQLGDFDKYPLKDWLWLLSDKAIAVFADRDGDIYHIKGATPLETVKLANTLVNRASAKCEGLFYSGTFFDPTKHSRELPQVKEVTYCGYCPFFNAESLQATEIDVETDDFLSDSITYSMLHPSTVFEYADDAWQLNNFEGVFTLDDSIYLIQPSQAVRLSSIKRLILSNRDLRYINIKHDTMLRYNDIRLIDELIERKL